MKKHAAKTSNPDAKQPLDYSVGYGRPPVHSRFRSGKSGNPKGRPRGRRNFGSMLKSVVNEMVSVREGDKVLRVSKLEAAMRSLVVKAIRGDVKAIDTLSRYTQQFQTLEHKPATTGITVRFVSPDNDDEAAEKAQKTAETNGLCKPPRRQG